MLPGAGLNIGFILAPEPEIWNMSHTTWRLNLASIHLWSILNHVYSAFCLPGFLNVQTYIFWPCLWICDILIRKSFVWVTFLLFAITCPGQAAQASLWSLVLSLPLPANICLHSNIFHKWWKMQLKSGEKGNSSRLAFLYKYKYLFGLVKASVFLINTGREAAKGR